MPGHVLIAPLRHVIVYQDLTLDEVSDLWRAAAKIGAMIRTQYKSAGAIYGVQDGKSAGQSVQHVHLHVLPRKEIKKIDSHEKEARTRVEMEEEAEIYRKFMNQTLV